MTSENENNGYNKKLKLKKVKPERKKGKIEKLEDKTKLYERETCNKVKKNNRLV